MPRPLKPSQGRKTSNGNHILSIIETLSQSGATRDEMAIATHFLQSLGTDTEAHFRLLATETFGEISVGLLESFDVSYSGLSVHRPESSFTFIDLFAGIGGMRTAFQRAGGRCIFSSEWDKHAQETYWTNFGEVPFGDITHINNEVPKHDVLVAGFPCQAFSIAGFKGGFEDTRGTLFFDVARLIDNFRPSAFLLENVKGLAAHDKGRTFNVIMETLENDLEYHVTHKIVNAKDFGVPQNRERVFIVGFKKKSALGRFEFPDPTRRKTTIADIKEKDVVSTKYYLSDRYLQTLVNHRDRHASKGNGFGFEIKNDDDIANAIVVGGMGRERNLVRDKRLTDYSPKTNIHGAVNRQGIRKMTPREWARLQGFPDSFVIPVSDAQAYKQFGNSVAVPAIEATAKKIVAALGLLDRS